MPVPRIVGVVALCWCIPLPSSAAPGDGNRLTYLDEPWNPYYVSRTFPKLTTPQWVGEKGVEAVVVLAIDDMRDPKKYEAYLRPILDRLKQIDGRAPVSIMTNAVDPKDPLLQQWLKEGLSLETHTIDHPCPLLAKRDFAAAKSTYDDCVDLMAQVPNSPGPVAFRMPCCDSLNTPSPRFFLEIFDKTTPAGRYLGIDSSVFNIITPNDPDLPRELVLDADGRERFRKYVPFDSFVNTIEDYPYPYIIGGLCWQFPCATPSDWQAQNLHKPDNPRTVEDWKALLDVTVIKQGVMNLVFHPHNWIKPQQVVELIDHATKTHGKKVKFLNFRECQERLDKHLLAGNPLRDAHGNDNGVRLLDVDNDGYMDVVVGNGKAQLTRVWVPSERRWDDNVFPWQLKPSESDRTAYGARFGVFRSDGYASVVVANEDMAGTRHFDGKSWSEKGLSPLKHLTVGGRSVFASYEGRDGGVRLRDIDGNGVCEVIVGNSRQQAIFWCIGAENAWRTLRFELPQKATLVDEHGEDAGVRFVDVNEDGYDDVLISNDRGYGLYLFSNIDDGWSRAVMAGKRGDPDAIPQIVRNGTDNGAWFHSRHLWVQNEDTAGMPNLVDRRSFAELTKGVPPGPKSPEASLACMKVRPGFTVELAAAEPLVMDPVNFDWGPDGKFWVVEMGDYPQGLDGKGKPGGRVRYLEDTDGDGRYDKSTLFLDGLPYPDGVLAWKKGVVIAAAPDILYAEDTDGDGRADKKEVLFTGFARGNPQHLVNGFARGLDNWIYGANGHSGGSVTSTKTGKQVALGGRDFRIRPNTGEIDPQSGITQFGRARDDWGNFFGCDNSIPIWHFILEDHYTRRNAHVAPPSAWRALAPAHMSIFPVSRPVERFNDFTHVNRITSSNSAHVYRDDLFGPAFENNWFVSEPVHNLVHRAVLEPDGVSFKSRRAPGEEKSEFLASTDNWFRPAATKTGPDGALWVASMYRQVIEHPEWIPMDWQRRVDLRAGSDKGRIYRVAPVGSKRRPIPKLADFTVAQLVDALDSPSGWQRDVAQQLLVERKDPAAVPVLEALALRSTRPQARLHALCTLDGMGALNPKLLATALADPHPGVRRHAVRLCEGRFADVPDIAQLFSGLASDPDAKVRLQLASTLGEWDDPAAGELLGRLALKDAGDEYLAAAVFSSLSAKNLTKVMATVLDSRNNGGTPPPAVVDKLLAVASATGDRPAMAVLLGAVSTPNRGGYEPWQFEAMARFLDALGRRESSLEKLAEGDAKLRAAAAKLPGMFDAARASATADDAGDTAPGRRAAAVALLGREPAHAPRDVAMLRALLVPQVSDDVQAAAVASLARAAEDDAPAMLLGGWKGYGPALRGRVLDALLAPGGGVRATLDAVEAKKVLATEIDAERRQRLLQSADAAVRARAATLLADVVNPDRQKVLAAYAPAMVADGEASRGQSHFTRLCIACHRLGDAGNAVGPDLAALTDKSPEFLLGAIIDPNRAVEARYTNYVADVAGGQTLSGIVAAETGNSVTLLGADGKSHVLLRSDLKSLRSTGTSLMPESLETGLTPQDMADLMAYVRGSSPPLPRKTLAGNKPEVVRPGPDGSLRLLPASAEIYGKTLILEEKYANLGYWSSEDDRVVWVVEPARPGKYGVWLEWACDDAVANNRFVLQTGSERMLESVSGTGGWDTYKRQKFGEVTLRLGRQRVTIKTEGPVAGALMDLKSVELVPAR